MSKSKAPVDLGGAMDLIKKSKFVLAPLFEGITNSLEAIASKTFREGEKGKIEIRLYFTGLVNEAKELQKIEIFDNGEGFTDASYERFGLLLDKSKGYNNRGSGRVQFLHRFRQADVISYYKTGGATHKRTFHFDEDQFVSDFNEGVDAENRDSETLIALSGFKPEKSETHFWDTIRAEDIKNEIARKFLLKLYLEQQKENHNAPVIRIVFYKNELVIDNLTIDPKEIPAPLSSDEIAIPYVKIRDKSANDIEWSRIPGKQEKLKWAHFKLPEAELDKNGIFLCSKDVAIQELSFLRIKKNESIAGYRYLTAVYGDILDKDTSVSDSVDRFLLPNQKDLEKEAKEDMFFDAEKEFILMDDIEKEIKKVIPTIYGDVQEIKQEQNTKLLEIARAHGISEDIAKSVDIDLADTEEKITEKLYKKQAVELASRNFKIKKIFETLTQLNPTSADYQTDLTTKGNELLELIPEQNKQELGRYVIRREMITKVLKLILENQLTYQNEKKESGERSDKEGLIHDLIFKRKTNTSEALNDLWILNEEFMHFDGCSELPLNQITTATGEKLLKDYDDEDELLKRFGINRTTRRPDIFLFAEQGQCILIEFKNKDEDLSNHLNQLTKYANLIANCALNRIDRFYCYLIGENVNRVDLPSEFERTAYGDLVKPHQPVKSFEPGREDITIATIYQEVIQLSAIHKRAAIRNKSFADKLGIRIDEIDKA